MRARARRATAAALLIAATSCSAERYRTYNCDGAGCRCNVGYFGATAEASGGCTPCPPAATTAAEGATDRAPHNYSAPHNTTLLCNGLPAAFCLARPLHPASSSPPRPATSSPPRPPG